MITLYQFPISHYVEKARWSLDAKGLQYNSINLTPILHAPYLAYKTKRTTVPTVQINNEWISGSTHIATKLEHIQPQPILFNPNHLNAIAEVDALSNRIGKLVRQWAYIYLINTDIPFELLFKNHPLPKPVVAYLKKGFQAAVKKQYKAQASYASQALQKLEDCMQQAQQLVQLNDTGYAVGEQFGFADIALCSMLAPIFSPPQSPWYSLLPMVEAQVPEITALRNKWIEQPLGQYVCTVYQKHRQLKADWYGTWRFMGL